MKLRSLRLSGTGNRFLVVDALGKELDEPTVARELEVGLDGLIAIHAATDASCAFRMAIHNRDGSRARMCGNGLRCAVYASELWARSFGEAFRVQTDVGALDVRVREGLIRTQVGAPLFQARDVPTTLAECPRVAACELAPQLLRGDNIEARAYVLAVGGPHLVLFVPDVDACSFDELGRLLERHAAFPDRANVHFAQRLGTARYRVRTWERGVGPTAACGTGAAAVAIAGADLQVCEAIVVSSGGELSVSWSGGADAAWVGGAVEPLD